MYRGKASQSSLVRKLGRQAGSIDLDMFERMAFKRIAGDGNAGKYRYLSERATTVGELGSVHRVLLIPS